jgi:hypothetical protein
MNDGDQLFSVYYDQINETESWATLTLFVIYCLMTLYALFNIYIVVYKQQRYKKILLLLFYVFAFTTVACKLLRSICDINSYMG